jgi:hypothetical protein
MEPTTTKGTEMNEVTANVNITSMKRVRNTTNGNGVWQVSWGHVTPGDNEWVGSARTKPDGHVGLGITGQERGRYEITLNGRNQITDMAKA